jgi:hypothetical protein
VGREEPSSLDLEREVQEVEVEATLSLVLTRIWTRNWLWYVDPLQLPSFQQPPYKVRIPMSS